MGVIIRSAAIESGSGSSVIQAAAAARKAIAIAGREPDEIECLINTGIYRDSNMVEPSIAALIQKHTGIGLEYATGRVPSYSFDLMNGACGVLNAIQAVQALLRAPAGRGQEGVSGRYALVVSGDAHPSMAPTPPPGFPVAPVGGALLLENVDGPAGFGALQISASDGSVPPEGFVHLRQMGTAGRSTIVVERPAVQAEMLLTHAVSAARRVIATDELAASRSLLITGRPAADFAPRLAQTLGFGNVWAPDWAGDPHTSALTVAYTQAQAAGRLAGVERLLFVAAGGGPTAAAISYRLTDQERAVAEEADAETEAA